MRYYRKILRISHKDHVTNEEVHAKIQQAIGPHEDLLTIVKRHKLQWYGHVSCSSGLAKTILQGTVKGGRRQGRQRKRWEDNIREWTGLEVTNSQRAMESSGKWRKLVAKSSVVPQRPSRLRNGWWWWWILRMHLRNPKRLVCLCCYGIDVAVPAGFLVNSDAQIFCRCLSGECLTVRLIVKVKHRFVFHDRHPGIYCQVKGHVPALLLFSKSEEILLHVAGPGLGGREGTAL